MKTHARSKCHGGLVKTIAASLAFLPSIALAHPGHYHPGEEDEFDALRANFLHLHGTLEISLALFAVASVLVFMINKNRRVRTAAAIALGGSLACIVAL